MGHKKKTLPVLDPYAKYRDRDLNYAWNENPNITSPNDPLVLFTVFIFKCPCGHPEYSEWQSPYLEAEDGQHCENPECCYYHDREILMPTDKVLSSTPCTFADCKYTGKFSCHVCLKQGRTTEWESLRAWTRKSQQCRECKTEIYPYVMGGWTQEEIDQRRKTMGAYRPTMVHRQELCAQCKELGRNCADLVAEYGSTEGEKRFYKKTLRKRRNKKKQPKEKAGVPPVTEGHVTDGAVAKKPQWPRQWVRTRAKLDKTAPTLDAKELAAKQASECADDGSALDQQVSAIKKKKRKPKMKKAVAKTDADGQGKQNEQARKQGLAPGQNIRKKDGATGQGEEELKRALTNLVTSFSALETASVPSLVK